MAESAVRNETRALASFLDSFQGLDAAGATNGHAWLRPVRRAAITRVADIGFPTIHDEDWRFTSLNAFVATAFRPAPEAAGQVTAALLAPFLFPGLAGHRLVFVNGRFAPMLSTAGAAPHGVRVQSLAEALARDRSLVEPHLARYEDAHQDAFSALSTAFIADGAFVHVPRGVVVEAPIHLLYISVPGGAPTATHPRNLIVLGEESQAAVVEDYVTLGDAACFSNVVTELAAGDGSVVSHYHVQRESRQAFHVATLRSRQGRGSSLTSHTALFGAAVTRRNVHPTLAGEGATCLLNGLFMANGRQHMDNYMTVEHASPHCDSRQFYKGVLDGQSRGVFHGRIIVHKDAQKTDAKQTNMNLLLSDDAQIDTKPQLEIYADDVKCTHGATIGQVDDEAIFYLRSRGIPAASARGLLLYAFAGDMLQRMSLEPVRRRLEQLVADWMPQGKLMEGVR